MALEEWLDENAHLTTEERARITGEIQLRLDNDELWDDSDDDDALAILVRKVDPKAPRGSSGIALRPNWPEASVDSRSIIDPDGL